MEDKRLHENERMKADLASDIESLLGTKTKKDSTPDKDVVEEKLSEGKSFEEKPSEEKKSDEVVLQEVVMQDVMPELEEVPDEKSLKKRKIMNLIYDLFIVIGVGLLIYAGVSLYQEFTERKEAKETYDDLLDQFVTVPKPGYGGGNNAGTEAGTEVGAKWYEQIAVDIDALQEINDDIVGWIYFENETISYPILYSLDNQEYLYKLYDGTWAGCGSIMLDAVNDPLWTDTRNIIYGHNMADMSMFGKLKYYKNEGYYDDNHQYFQIITDTTIQRYQIFSYFDVQPTEVNTINTFFDETNTYQSCLDMLKSRSRRDHGVEVTTDDKIVTLVTCAYYGTQRFLVSAVLVDEYVYDPDETPSRPDTQRPDINVPSNPQNPDTQNPDTQVPDTQAPGTNPTPTPDTQTPGTNPTPDPGTGEGGSSGDGNGDAGTGEGGSSGDGSGDAGTGEGGSGGDGSGDAGTGEGGSGGDGSGDAGTGEGGSSGDGSGDAGTGEGGSSEDGSGDAGTGEGGSSGDGSGDTGTGEGGNTGDGNGDAGTGEGGSSEDGSGDAGTGETGDSQAPADSSDSE